MDSARSFVRLWLLFAALILAYAWLDLRLNPGLRLETHFSMQPDFGQVHDLWHWGGRLLKHGELWLLVGNALVLAGLAALVVHGAVQLVRRLRSPRAERVSVVPGGFPNSVPPP